MSGLAVFAYGSLVSPASAAMTLGRPVELAATATLAGWTRGWTVCRDNLRTEKTFARPDGSVPRFCLGLGIEPVAIAAGRAPTSVGASADARAPNGALIEVSEAELARLDIRELRYRRAEVTAAVDADSGFEAVFAYRSRPEHHRPRPPADAIVIAAYVRAVEAAFATLDDGQLERFRASTADPPVEVCEAELVSDRIPEGNPRTW